MLIPLQLEAGTTVRLLPVACGAIALLCIVIHVAVITSSAERQAQDATGELIEALNAEPAAAVPSSCTMLFAPAAVAQRTEPSTERATQACAAWLTTRDRHPVQRYGLVPSRGLWQRGLWTFNFLHAGWAHLLGNLLFLWITGPVLEDRWGRKLFLLFFVLGGMVSGATQALADPSSTRPIIGASGAIAACMGAFAILFYQRKVQMLLWLGILVKRFYVPAWLWTGVWIATELWSYWLVGLDSPVAVLVHIGGFFAGVGFALVVKRSGLDARWSAAVERSITMEVAEHPAFAEAEALAAQREWRSAHEAYQRVLRDQPKDGPALHGALLTAFTLGDVGAGGPLLERYLALCFADSDRAAVVQVLRVVGEAGIATLRPAAAHRAAQLVVEDDRALSAALSLVAGEKGHTAAAQRAAQLFAELRDDHGVARAHAALTGAPLPPTTAGVDNASGMELAARAPASTGQAEPPPSTWSSGLELSREPRSLSIPRTLDGKTAPIPRPPPPPPQPQVFATPAQPVRAAELQPPGVLLATSSGQRLLRYEHIAAVAAGFESGAPQIELRAHDGARYQLTVEALEDLVRGPVTTPALHGLVSELVALSGAVQG